VIAKPSLVDRLLRAYARTRLRGFARLWRLSGRPADGSLRATTAKGTVFELSPFAYIDSIVIREGYYEPEVTDALVAGLGDGVLWDVGANFGLHGITAKFLRPRSRVLCFEPSPAMLDRLGRNRALNGLDVDILGIALSNRTGSQELFLGPPGNPGMSTLSPWTAATYAGSCVVAVARGDDLLEGGRVPAPTVIKLDVEGHELPVLEGLSKALSSPALRTVVFEDRQEAGTPVKALLGGAGFACERLNRHPGSRHGLENFAARRA